MYVLYDRGIDIVFLNDFSIKVLDCSDSVVFPFAHMIHKHVKLSSVHSLFIYGMFIFKSFLFLQVSTMYGNDVCFAKWKECVTSTLL